MKINNFDEVAKDSLYEWLYYFKTSALPKVYGAKGLTEVAEQLKIDAMDAATKAKYQKYLDAQLFTESALESAYDNGYFNGEKKGELKGELKGAKQERQKSVVKLASLGIPHDTFAVAFGISVEEIRAILEQKD